MNSLRWLLVLPLLALVAPASAAVVAGGGTVQVTQGPDSQTPKELGASVRMTGALSANVTDDGGVIIRFQFVRPDARAIAFLVLTLPENSPLTGTYLPTTPGTDLLYYEQAPGDDSNQFFVSSAWAGEISAQEPLAGGLADVTLALNLTVVDEGSDGQLNTDDDQVRRIQGNKVRLALRGDLSGLSYTYVGDEVYISSDTVIIYEDGCSGSPDYYDDYDYYDSPEYTDETGDSYQYEDDWEGSSCDGDTYDDSDSDWDDSGDSSCSADDDYGDSDTSSSSCDGDSWDDDEDEEWAASAAIRRGGFGGKGPHWLAKPIRKRGLDRLAPLAGALLGWVLLKWATRRRMAARCV